MTYKPLNKQARMSPHWQQIKASIKERGKEWTLVYRTLRGSADRSAGFVTIPCKDWFMQQKVCYISGVNLMGVGDYFLVSKCLSPPHPILLITCKGNFSNSAVEIKLNITDKVQLNFLCLWIGYSKRDTLWLMQCSSQEYISWMNSEVRLDKHPKEECSNKKKIDCILYKIQYQQD